MIKKIEVILLVLSLSIIGGIIIQREHNTKFVNSINFQKKEPIYKMAEEKKELFLTFDINWAEDDKTYEILDILKEKDVRATFFIMGKWIKYPKGNKEKLEKIKEGGHTIGNHSYIHPDFKEISKERMKKEILDTEKIIEDTIDLKTTIFRFPSGSFSEEAVETVYNLGYAPIQWNIDSKDWMNEGLEKEYLNVKNKLKNGSIILYHNNGKYTPENLKRLIKECKEEGYTFEVIK